MASTRTKLTIVAIPLTLVVIITLAIMYLKAHLYVGYRIVYVVPDNFQGLIVVHYGQDLPGPYLRDNQLTITINPDGTASLPHAAPVQSFRTSVRYASGARLLQRADNPPPDAIAFYHLSTEFPPDSADTEPIADIFLVGTLQQFEDWSERDPADFTPGPFN